MYAKRRWFSLIFINLSLIAHAIVMSPLAYASAPIANETLLFGPTTFRAHPNPQNQIANFTTATAGSATLLIVNGTGLDLSLEKCSGSLFKRLICELENVLKEITALLTCAQNVQMELNGQTVLTGSEVNLKVSNYKRVIPVGSGTNTFKVKVKGLPTASITLKIIGGGATPPANLPPVASFTNQVDSQNPLLVHFNGSSSSDPDGSISLYIWQFGDGQSGQGLTLSHLYTAAGTYLVSLAVTDNRGASASTSQSIVVETPNLAPTISLTNTAVSGTAPHLVIFDATGSFDPEQEALTYLWNFGDGITTTGAYVSHQYMTPNNYVTQLRVRDARGGESVANITIAALAPVSPIDPALIAPPLPIQQGSTPAGPGLQFLYTGANPVQTGVAPGIIDTKRAGSIRGRVLDRAGAGIAGVEVSVLKHPEYGKTLTRPDGFYDLVVNGGGYFTFVYSRPGYFDAQRSERIDWQLMAAMEDVVMIGLDPQVTPVDLNSPTPQLAKGSVVNDSDGNRQAVIYIPSQTQATLKFPNGSSKAVNKLSLRATEFTVGDNGLQAMPGPLPPQSAYTYAFEFSADEAIASGASRIDFNRNIPFYVDNFLNIPVGNGIPLGFYDRDQGHWAAENDGIVLKILSIDQGLAVLDLEGNNQPASSTLLSAWGISNEELSQLAGLYPIGKTFWRFQTQHMTPGDGNLPYELANEDPADPPPGEKTAKDENEDNNCPITRQASIIDVDRGTLGEEIDLPGTGMKLTYNSERVPGRSSRLEITLTETFGAKAPPVAVELFVWIAGREFKQRFNSIAPNMKTVFAWDGQDVYGREVQGSYPARIGIHFVHQIRYISVSVSSSSGRRSFGSIASSVGRSISPARLEAKLTRSYRATLSHIDYRFQKLGGWTFDQYHYYDPIGQSLYYGSGERSDRSGVVKTIAGTGISSGSSATNGLPGENSPLSDPFDVAVMPDGSVLIADSTQQRIRLLRPNGIMDTFAGGGISVAENVPATQTSLAQPRSVAVMPSGEVLIGELNRVRKVDRNGIIRTVAGTGIAGFSGDEGPALNAQFNSITGLVASADGSYYISESGNNRIRRVTPDGVVHTVVGNGTAGTGGDGGPATEAQLRFPQGIDVADDGTIYIADTTNSRIRKVGADGNINTVVTSASSDPTILRLSQPRDIAVGVDGGLYIVNVTGPTGVNTILRLTTDGKLSRIAGLDTGGFNGDGRVPEQTQLLSPEAVEVGPDLSVYVADRGNRRIRKIFTGLPLYSGDSIRVASSNGTEYYLFSPEGLHQETRNSLTNSLIYKFNYQAGLLSSIQDAFGNEIAIQRDSSGQAQQIISPYGQGTHLSMNSSGFLASVRNALNEEHLMSYDSAGLMQSFQPPNGFANTFQYDSLGYLLREDRPDQGFFQFLRQDLTAPLRGHEVRTSTAEGRQSIMTLQSAPNGLLSTIYQDENGISLTVTGRHGFNTRRNADGSSITLEREADPLFGGQAYFASLEQRQMRAGLVQTISRSKSAIASPLGSGFNISSLTETVSINNKQFTSVYNGATRTFTDTSAQGRQSFRQIDTFGRLTNDQVGALTPTNYIYESRGRLSEIHQGPRITKINYDSAGFVDSIETPLHQTTSFDYDSVGRVLTQTLPDLRQIQFTYDSNGNLSSITPPSRPAHGFLYSTVDLISSYLPPSLGGPAVNTVYSYNRDKQLTRIARPDGKNVDLTYAIGKERLASIQAPSGTYSYGYSPTSGLLTSINAPDGVVMSYAYDGSLPRLFTWSGAINGSVAFGYNNDFQVSAISVNGIGIPYTYDNDGLLRSAGALSIARDANGLITSTQLGAIGDNYFYNSFGEVTLYTATGYSVSYIRDDLGRIIQKTEDVIGVISVYDYIYDNAGRLDQVRKNNVLISDYNYDGNSNRIAHNGTVGTYDAQDRLLTYGNNSYTYSLNGELATKHDNLLNQTTSYVYDEFGNLQQVTLPNGDVIEYIIDGQNRRVGKKLNGVLIQGFLYQDQLEPVAELDGSGNIVARFIYASKSHIPDFMIKNGNTYRIISDHLGSPRLVINIATNQVVQQTEYDEFGNMLSDSFPGFQPFGFAGSIFDNSTKLVRMGARDYSGSEGRWISKDPILFDGGDVNLFGYVFSDPVNLTDSYGLAFDDKFRGGGGAVPNTGGIIIRPDVQVSGGRGGQNVRNLIGPPNSAIRGGGNNRVFITNQQGQVIRDITSDRAKPVTPGQGFGPKEPLSQFDKDILGCFPKK